MPQGERSVAYHSRAARASAIACGCMPDPARRRHREDLAHWLARAEEATCVELRREALAEEKTQMCERGELRVRVPGRMVRLLGELVWAVRAARHKTSHRWPGSSPLMAPACTNTGTRSSAATPSRPGVPSPDRCRRALPARPLAAALVAAVTRLYWISRPPRSGSHAGRRQSVWPLILRKASVATSPVRLFKRFWSRIPAPPPNLASWRSWMWSTSSRSRKSGSVTWRACGAWTPARREAQAEEKTQMCERGGAWRVTCPRAGRMVRLLGELQAIAGGSRACAAIGISDDLFGHALARRAHASLYAHAS
jgi:hypothetical protein